MKSVLILILSCFIFSQAGAQKIYTQPEDYTICGSYSFAEFSVEVSGENSPTFEWYQSVEQYPSEENDDTGWTRIENNGSFYGGIASGATTHHLIVRNFAGYPSASVFSRWRIFKRGIRLRCKITRTAGDRANVTFAYSNAAFLLKKDAGGASPLFASHPIARSTCVYETNSQFSAQVSGALTYMWQIRNPDHNRDGGWQDLTEGHPPGFPTLSLFTGYNTNTLSIPDVNNTYVASYQPENDRFYRLKASNACGTVYSRPARHLITLSTFITEQPASLNVCMHDVNAVFQVKVTGRDLTYQWEEMYSWETNWRTMPDPYPNNVGVRDPVFTYGTPAWPGVGSYASVRVAITNSCGTIRSQVARLDVIEATPPTITAQPSLLQEKCANGTATFTVSATGTALSYQWQRLESGEPEAKDPPWSNWQDGWGVSGATTQALTFSGHFGWASEGKYVRAVVSNACLNKKYATFKVLSAATYPHTEITLHPPIEISQCTGDKNVVFEADGQGDKLKYQWQTRAIGGTTWNNITGIGSALTKTYIHPEVGTVGAEFRLKVSNSCGEAGTSVCTLNVNPVQTPVFTQHPQDQNKCWGNQNVVFEADAGSAVTYQWQSSQDKVTWSNVSGTTITGHTGKILTYAQAPHPDDPLPQIFYLRLAATNACRTAYSNAAKFSINRAAPFILTQPADLVAKCAGDKNVSFNVAASDAMTWQWEEKLEGAEWHSLSNTGHNMGANTAAFTYKDISGAVGVNRYLRCRITNTCGNTTSNESQLVVSANCPSANEISYQPNDYTVCGNAVYADFRVEAPRGAAFQWYQSVYENPGVNNWTILEESSFYGGLVSGNTTKHLEMSNFPLFLNQPWTGSKPGLRLRCKITLASGGTIYSEAAVLIKGSGAVRAPQFSVDPVDRTACSLDTDATFGVTMLGSTPATYQWQVRHHSGENLGIWKNCAPSTPPGVESYTGRTVYLPDLRDSYYSNSDNYFRIKATNSCGTVYSAQAKLEVTVPPVITTQPAVEVRQCAIDREVSFNVIAFGKSLSYQWEYKPGVSGAWGFIPVHTNNAGATTNTFTFHEIGGLTTPVFLRCKVFNGCGGYITSEVSQLIISPDCPAANEITYQPVDYTVCGNTNYADFRTEAPHGVAFQWYKAYPSSHENPGETDWEMLTNGDFYGGTAINSNTTHLELTNFTTFAELPWTGTKPGLRLRCKITLANGGVIYSRMAVLKKGTGTAASPRFTTDPVDVFRCYSPTATPAATFSAGVTVGTVIWQVRHPVGTNTGTWQDCSPGSPSGITGYITNDISISNPNSTYYTAGDNYFRLKASSGCGTAYGKEAKLTVSLPPVVTSVSPAICVPATGSGSTTLTANRAPAATSAWAITSSFGAVFSMTDQTSSNNASTVRVVAGSWTDAGNVNAEFTDHLGCKATTTLMVKRTPVITPVSSSLCAAVNGVLSTTRLQADRDPSTTLTAWQITNLTPSGAEAALTDDNTSDRWVDFQVANAALAAQKSLVVRYTDHSGCQGTTTITINPNPVITFGNSSICASVNGAANSITLTAGRDPSAIPPAWRIVSPGTTATLEDADAGDKLVILHVTSAALAIANNVIVRYTDHSGCEGTTTITVNPNPVVIPATPTACTFTPLTLTGSRTPAVQPAWAIISPSVNASLTNENSTHKTVSFLATSTAVQEFTVEFTDHLGCKGRSIITVNPRPVIESGGAFDLTRLCEGNVIYQDAISITNDNGGGTWKLYTDSDGTIEGLLSTVAFGSTSITGKITTGDISTRTTALTRYVGYSSSLNCKSNRLEITIHTRPSRVDAIPPLLATFCEGSAATLPLQVTPEPAGAEKRPAGYAWELVPGITHTADIGLPDNPRSGDTPEAFGFTPTAAGTRKITLYSYNQFGCINNTGREVSLVVKARPGLSASVTSLCGATRYDNLVTASPGSTDNTGIWKIYTALTGTTEATTLLSAGTAIASRTITTEVNEGEEALLRYVSYSYTGCSSERLQLTIHGRPQRVDDESYTLCDGGSPVTLTPLRVTPAPAGDEKIPFTYAWELVTGSAHTADIGLADHPRSLAAQGEITFTPRTGRRNITIYSYNRFGCINNTGREVSIEVKDNLLISADPSILCGGTQYENAITASTGPTGPGGVWKIYTTNTGTEESASIITAGSIAGAGTIITENNDYVAAFTRYVSYSYSGCHSNRVPLTIHGRPARVDAISPPVFCEGNTATLSPRVTPAPTGDEKRPVGYAWESGIGFANLVNIGLADNPRGATPQEKIEFTARPGMCSFTIYSYNRFGCVNNEGREVTITVNPRPVITPENPVICAPGFILLSANRDPVTSPAWVSTSTEASLQDENASAKSVRVVAGTLTGQRIANVEFTDILGCKGTTMVTINPTPVIAFGNINASAHELCSGGTISLTKNISGDLWQISQNATGPAFTSATTITPNSHGTSTFTAGQVAADVALVQEIHFQSGNCAGNSLHVTINPKPVATLSAAVSLCGDRPALIPLSTGGGLRAATGYKWNQSGAHNDQVNLYDHVGTWATGIPPFSPPLPTTPAILNRSMVIRPYNSSTLCTGDEKTWTITVTATPVISRNGNAIDLARLCAGAVYDGAVAVSPVTTGGNWVVYKGGTTEAGIISTEAVPSSTSGLANIRAGNNAVSSTSEDLVFISTAACKSNTLPIIINPVPLMGNEVSLDTREFCHGEVVPEWAPPSGGAGMTKPNAFQWQVVAGTNSSTIGLDDHFADWTKSKISGFTTTNSTLNTIGRDLMVTGRNEGTGCTVAKRMRLNVSPSPVIEAATGINLAKLCAGSLYPNAITISSGGTVSGEWLVRNAGTTRVSSISTKVENDSGHDRGSLEAGNASRVTIEGVVYKSALNCLSNILSITIYPQPVMNEIPDMAYCSGSSVPAFTPASAGVGEARPSAWQWRLAGNAVNNAPIGLSDYFSDWDKNAISGFPAATATATGMLKRDITITGRNATSGCQTNPQMVTLTINSNLALTQESLSPICSGTKTNILLRSSLSHTIYTWTVSPNNTGALPQSTATEDAAIKQALTNSGNSMESVTYNVTGRTGSCHGMVSVEIEVSHSPGVTASVSGGAKYCVDPQDNKYQTNLVPGVSGATNVEWIYTSYFPIGQADIVRGASKQMVKGHLDAVRDNLTLTGQASALVYYVFRAFSGGCFGAATAPIEVSLYPVPVAEVVAVPEVCSNSRTNIQVTGLTSHVTYTWRVDQATAVGVTGFTELSREGAQVSSANPPASKGSPVNDLLSMSDNQTRILTYWITPWHQGCPGQAREARVQVNPLPVLTRPDNRQHCAGVLVPAEILSGSDGANEFKWTGGAAAGLADQTVYGTGLPDYRAAITDKSVTAQVSVSARNVNGCESAWSSFRISVSPKPVIHPDAPLLSLCAGPATEKAATAKIGISSEPAGITYKWSASFMDKKTGGNSSVKMVNNETAVDFPVEENTPQTGDLVRKITATPGSNGTITFYLTPELSGCRGEVVSATAEVRGINLHQGIVNNSATGICSGSAANIKVGEAGDGNVYSWTIADQAGNVQGYQTQLSSAATTISDVLTLNNNKRGNITYSIVVSNMGSECVGTTLPYTIFVNPVPVLTELPATVPICSGVQTNISLSVNLTAPELSQAAYTWQVSENKMGAQSSGSTPTGFEQQTLTNPSVTDSGVTYTFTPWYSPGTGGSCGGLPVAVVYTVSTLPVAGISDVPEKVCMGDKITLNATPEGLSYQWLKEGGLIAEAAAGSYEVPTDTEEVSSYSVTVTNSCGSHTSVTKEVSVSAEAYFADGKAVTDKENKTAATDEVVNFSYSGSGTEVDYLWNYGDDTHAPDVKCTAHIFYKPGTYHPVLQVVKKGQSSCTKTFQLEPLEITGTGVSPYTIDPVASAGLNVFPIPAYDLLTIVNNEDLQHITISDFSGRTVLSKAVNGRKATLPVGSFANGVYLLTIIDSKGVKRTKISKKR